MPPSYPYFEASWDRVAAAYAATTITLALLMVGAVVPELTDRTGLVEAGSYTGEFLYECFWVVSSCAVGVAMFWMPVGALLYVKNLRNPLWYLIAGFLLLALPSYLIGTAAYVGQPHQFPSLGWKEIAETAVIAGAIGALAAFAGWRVAFRRFDRLNL